jgi:hypothetical protein
VELQDPPSEIVDAVRILGTFKQLDSALVSPFGERHQVLALRDSIVVCLVKPRLMPDGLD